MIDVKPLKIEELTASPGMTSVSEVAKGGTPVTGQQEEEMMQHKPGEEPEPEEKDGHCSIEEMQEAYAKIFEGLAMLSRS